MNGGAAEVCASQQALHLRDHELLKRRVQQQLRTQRLLKRAEWLHHHTAVFALIALPCIAIKRAAAAQARALLAEEGGLALQRERLLIRGRAQVVARRVVNPERLYSHTLERGSGHLQQKR